MKRYIGLILILLYTSTISATLLKADSFSSNIKLSWPISCTIGKNCWVVNYVDQGISVEGQHYDFQCGTLTYDGHKGTDIAIKDRRAGVRNIQVLAAAAGKVLRIRNTVEDSIDAPIVQQSIDTGTECGNGVIISHSNGWETIYCHMKKNSIVVKSGENIIKGQLLGNVGQSGKAEFTHLHFAVKHNKAVIDPFTGKAATGCGTPDIRSLWSRPISYNPLMLYASGFSDHVPIYSKIIGDTSTLQYTTVNAPILAFWTLSYGAQAGDRIEIKILDPDGKIFAENRKVQKKDKARSMLYVGKKIKNKLLKQGTYKGKTIFERSLSNGLTIQRIISNNILVK